MEKRVVHVERILVVINYEGKEYEVCPTREEFNKAQDILTAWDKEDLESKKNEKDGLKTLREYYDAMGQVIKYYVPSINIKDIPVLDTNDVLKAIIKAMEKRLKKDLSPGA